MTLTQCVDHIDFNCSERIGTTERDEISVVQRLRASRATFLKTVSADARETGKRWLKEDASYEQIKCLVHASLSDGPADTATESQIRRVLHSVDAFVDRLSTAPIWARNDSWYDAFAGAAIADWNKIALQVEREG